MCLDLFVSVVSPVHQPGTPAKSVRPIQLSQWSLLQSRRRISSNLHWVSHWQLIAYKRDYIDIRGMRLMRWSKRLRQPTTRTPGTTPGHAIMKRRHWKCGTCLFICTNWHQRYWPKSQMNITKQFRQLPDVQHCIRHLLRHRPSALSSTFVKLPGRTLDTRRFKEHLAGH